MRRARRQRGSSPPSRASPESRLDRDPRARAAGAPSVSGVFWIFPPCAAFTSRRARRQLPGRLLRLLPPRPQRGGIRFRQRLQRWLDGFAADDLAVAHEHPVRDVGFSEFDLVACPLARQIAWLVGEEAGIAPIG